MHTIKNILLNGSGGKQIPLDIFYTAHKPSPVIIYVHGFNGFKDWGNFDLIAEQFADAGFCFLKFNFSHNGTSPQHPEDFVDLEAFGNNNYTTELKDLGRVIDWTLKNDNVYAPAIDKNKIFLLGHSLGGGIAILKAAEDKRVRGLATWASISECKTPWGNWPSERIERWKALGVEYYTNSRTNQQMPLYYQLFLDYQNNQERLDIIKAAYALDIPFLICHGKADEAVSITSALQLKQASSAGKLLIVDSDHVFGRKHPWPHPFLPPPTQEVVNATIEFFSCL